MKGKVVIVTGASSGIGFAAANELYNRGAKVYLACRNEEKTLACIKRMEEGKSSDSGQAVFLKLDLDDPRGAKASAERFMELEERLDILVNNAAIMAPKEVDIKPEYGVEQAVITNYFSTRIFTETLLPVLRKTDSEQGSDVRIANTTTSLHAAVPDGLHFKTIDDLNLDFSDKFHPVGFRYCFTKLLVILWTIELQSRLSSSGSGILVMAVHPGAVQTEGQANSSAALPRLLRPIFNLLVKVAYLSVKKGIASTMFATTSPDVRQKADSFKAAYIVPPGKIGTASKQARDPENVKRLQELADGKIKEWGISLPE